jgi:hypothetical protein
MRVATATIGEHSVGIGGILGTTLGSAKISTTRLTQVLFHINDFKAFQIPLESLPLADAKADGYCI